MTEGFGTCTARAVWFVTEMIPPEGPNNRTLSLWRLANICSIRWMKSRRGQRVNSIISPKSPRVRHALTVIFRERDDGARVRASAPSVALKSLLRSGAFSSISGRKKKKKKVGLRGELRIRGCKDFRYNCLKVVISHLLSDLQKMQGAFHVPSVSHNPPKSQITPYSPWTLR